MRTFDIVLKKMHCPCVNRFDGDIVLVQFDLTIRTKVVMIQQKYEAITGVNYRADTKRFKLFEFSTQGSFKHVGDDVNYPETKIVCFEPLLMKIIRRK